MTLIHEDRLFPAEAATSAVTLSIPARHDVARRVDCAYLARLVAEGQIGEDEALEVACELATELARRAYKL